MSKFTPGQPVRILCEVQRGAFPSEVLVTFETVEGPVSGFVNNEAVEKANGHSGYIGARVTDVSKDVITVIVKGSFFTTTGLASLKRDWANSHVEPAHA